MSRSDNRFLRKDIPDTANGEITFRKGVTLQDGFHTADYEEGAVLAPGAALRKEGDTTVFQCERIVVTKSLEVNELKVNRVTHVGGKQIYSAAGMKVSAVEDIGNNYRCFFDTKEGSEVNMFAVDDLCYTQQYSPDYTSVIRYYWRRVVAIGPDYIDLSKSDADLGSATPKVGDEIAQLGNKTDKTRQAARIIDVIGGNKDTFYEGINSYSLAGRDEVFTGVEGGRVKQRIYGDSYIGDRKRNSYIEKTDSGVDIKAKVTFTAGSTGLTELTEWQEVTDANIKADAAAEAAQAAKDNIDNLRIGGVNLLNGSKGDTLEGWAVPANTESKKFGVEKVDGEYRIFELLESKLTGAPNQSILSSPYSEYVDPGEYTISIHASQKPTIVSGWYITVLALYADGTMKTVLDGTRLGSPTQTIKTFSLAKRAKLRVNLASLFTNRRDPQVVHLWFNKIKIERGPNATAWTPSESDSLTSAYSYLKKALPNGKFEVGVEGISGVVVANVMGVSAPTTGAYTLKLLRAGLSGIADDGVSFFAHNEDAYNVTRNYFSGVPNAPRPLFGVSDDGRGVLGIFEVEERQTTIHSSDGGRAMMFVPDTEISEASALVPVLYPFKTTGNLDAWNSFTEEVKLNLATIKGKPIEDKPTTVSCNGLRIKPPTHGYTFTTLKFPGDTSREFVANSKEAWNFLMNKPNDSPYNWYCVTNKIERMNVYTSLSEYDKAYFNDANFIVTGSISVSGNTKTISVLATPREDFYIYFDGFSKEYTPNADVNIVGSIVVAKVKYGANDVPGFYFMNNVEVTDLSHTLPGLHVMEPAETTLFGSNWQLLYQDANNLFMVRKQGGAMEMVVKSGKLNQNGCGLRVNSSGVQINQGTGFKRLSSAILASGSVDESGAQDKTFGEKVNGNTASRSNGLYGVPHRVGHGNYSVQITPRTPDRACYITAKENNLFYVQFTSLSSATSGVTAAFDYTIIGENI